MSRTSARPSGSSAHLYSGDNADGLRGAGVAVDDIADTRRQYHIAPQIAVDLGGDLLVRPGGALLLAIDAQRGRAFAQGHAGRRGDEPLADIVIQHAANAADLARFARMMLSGGTLDGVRVLRASTIAQFTALAVLLPVVAGQSGNAGAQALAVTMRGLALMYATGAPAAPIERAWLQARSDAAASLLELAEG